MMKRKKAVTLLELVIAMALLAVMTATTTTSFISIKSLRQNFLNREAGFAQANLAVATVFERALRTGGGAVGVSAFTIEPGGRTVVLRRLVGAATLTERIWFDSATHEVKYVLGTQPDKVILKGVQDLWFSNDFSGDFGQRLALEVTLQDGQKIRTSVQPRNQRTPQAVIN